ncbi:MAG: hypothetical protein PVJ67_06495 [Candidatus Pacearchaeota archaeon]|jgi:hypothetical protein
MKTKFLIDAKAEAENIPGLIELGGRSVLFHPYSKRIINKSGKELYEEVTKIHNENKNGLEKLRKGSEKNWRKIEEDYIKEMEKLTGHKLIQNKKCYFAPTIKGIADVRGGKNVFVGIEFNQDTLNYIVPHELTHLHYVDVVGKLKLYEAWKSPLMEAVDHLILFKTPIKNLINSKTNYSNINFVRSNPRFMKELETLWNKRKDFKSFLEEAIKVQRKTKNIKIC